MDAIVVDLLIELEEGLYEFALGRGSRNSRAQKI